MPLKNAWYDALLRNRLSFSASMKKFIFKKKNSDRIEPIRSRVTICFHNADNTHVAGLGYNFSTIRLYPEEGNTCRLSESVFDQNTCLTDVLVERLPASVSPYKSSDFVAAAALGRTVWSVRSSASGLMINWTFRSPVGSSSETDADETRRRIFLSFFFFFYHCCCKE